MARKARRWIELAIVLAAWPVISVLCILVVWNGMWARPALANIGDVFQPAAAGFLFLRVVGTLSVAPAVAAFAVSRFSPPGHDAPLSLVGAVSATIASLVQLGLAPPVDLVLLASLLAGVGGAISGAIIREYVDAMAT